MGSEFQYFTTDVDEAELEAYVDGKITESVTMYGMDVYSGQLNHKSGVSVNKTKLFGNESEAYDYVMNNTDKWGDRLLAVPYLDVTEVEKKTPTYCGIARKDYRLDALYVFCGKPDSQYIVCVAGSYRDLPGDWFPESGGGRWLAGADQLTEARKARVIEKYNEYAAARAELELHTHEYKSLMSDLSNYRLDLTGTLRGLWADAKVRRKELFRLYQKSVKAANVLIDLDAKYGKKLRETQTVNNGKRWLVGALCPS